MIGHGVMTQDDIDAVRAAIQAEVDEAVEFARNSPFPEVDAMLEDVYTVAAGVPEAAGTGVAQ